LECLLLATPQEVFDSIKDWVAVSNGQPGGTWAYMTGRLKIRGDQGLARKLGQIFP
jgi:putative sterol carrier protein